MNPYEIRLHITCRAPILSAAGGALGLGLDSAMQRDGQGRPALPGDLVKGNLRQAWGEFRRLAGGALRDGLPEAWLGRQPGDGDFEPARARLGFDHRWVDEAWSGEGEARPLYRIRIDEATGAADTGMLQVIESPYPVGQPVTFSGTIQAWLADDDEAERLQVWLRKGLYHMRQLGANKGQGFGLIEQVATECRARQGQPVNKVSGDRWGLEIRPHGPFCIGKPAVGTNNRFDTETFIPGAAILGALATTLWELAGPQPWPALAGQFDRLRVGHALPAARASLRRPVTPPLSLAIVETGRGQKTKRLLFDLAGFATPHYFQRYQDTSAPGFQPDWKDKQRRFVDERFGIPEIATGLDLHTAIDAESGSAATGMLYSVEAVQPGDKVWLADIDFGQVDAKARGQVKQELRELLAWGLDNLGKLKTRADVAIAEPAALQHPQADLETLALQPGSRVRVLLQTPALLLLPGQDLPTNGGGERLHRAYAAAWEELSGAHLALSHFHALQDLRGGRHWHGRFRRPDAHADPLYQPVLHTRAGSLFVLEVVDADQARTALADWQRYGLPQRRGAPGGEAWQYNPWRRNNGYGEVLIDPELPVDEPREGDWHAC